MAISTNKRVVEENQKFYPEYRRWGFWHRYPLELEDSGHAEVSFLSLIKAQEYLGQRIKKEVMVIHPFEEPREPLEPPRECP